MYNESRTKKEFQKVIKAIRGDNKFPKAMMTGQQCVNMTATVNCGGEWKPACYTKELAERVLEDKEFQEFLTRNDGTARLENNRGTYQIRIYFAEPESYEPDEEIPFFDGAHGYLDRW